MKIAISKERRAHETRVATSHEIVKKLVDLSCEVGLDRATRPPSL